MNPKTMLPESRGELREWLSAVGDALMAACASDLHDALTSAALPAGAATVTVPISDRTLGYSTMGRLRQATVGGADSSSLGP